MLLGMEIKLNESESVKEDIIEDEINIDSNLDESVVDDNKFSLYKAFSEAAESIGETLSIGEAYFYRYIDEAYGDIINLDETKLESLNEEDKKGVFDKINKFIKDAKEFIDKTSKNISKEEKNRMSKSFLGLGISTLFLILSFNNPGNAIYSIISIIASLYSIYQSEKLNVANKDKMIKGIEAVDAEFDAKLKEKLEKAKAKSKDSKIKEALDKVINKIKA